MSSEPFYDNSKLRETSLIPQFPYDKLLCIEASLKYFSSDELKTIVFPYLEKALNAFFNLQEIEECIVIQKCNCVEIYIAQNSVDSQKILTEIKETWEQLLGHPFSTDIWNKIRILSGKSVIEHLFLVASSMESLIIGDNQVLSQVTAAYDFAHKQGTVKTLLSHIFKEAFLVAKKVYTQTRMHDCGASLGRVAVAIIKTNFSIPPEMITVVGSGQTGEVVVNAIQEKWKLTKINVITQRPKHIQEKYKNPIITGYPRSEILHFVRQSDAIILCTDTIKPIIKADDMRENVTHGKLKILIDLGMPPNSEPIENSSLVVYSLLQVVEFGKTKYQERMEEVKIAQKIIEFALDKFEDSIFEYKKTKILKTLAPEINKAMAKSDPVSAVMGILIRLFNNLSVDELNAIEMSANNIT